jgi:hypothetical protein
VLGFSSIQVSNRRKLPEQQKNAARIRQFEMQIYSYNEETNQYLSGVTSSMFSSAWDIVDNTKMFLGLRRATADFDLTISETGSLADD